ncbi:hypothetical protein JQ607_22215 [Bradyrhizobium liaoningense]|uniref:hypothetical protein n=1 Tax=Bradyrhizobium liaoningense TaxID=43992 RepID=UPI001BA92C6A|nr:hypothetical protein [Bradyrhizobium liaoningense]MBR0842926.1 hypothetical protein [Bradyrhizobium liaoningense]
MMTSDPETVRDLGPSCEEIGLRIKESVDFLHAINRIEYQFLRRRLIPHEVLARDIGVSPLGYAIKLRDYLAKSGLHSEADFLHKLAPIIGNYPPKFVLRIIFPEIEETFRQKVYEPPARSVVKFREARYIILNHIARATPAACIQILSKTDPFLLIQLVFLDLAYADVEESKPAASGYPRFQRSLKYIGNRHEFLHGLKPAGRSRDIPDNVIINVLTLYVSAVRICQYLSELLISRGNLRLTGQHLPDPREFIALTKKVAATFRQLASALPRSNSSTSS